MMLWVLLIIGIVVLAIVIVVGWGILKLAGDIDQHREDWHGERRS